MCSYFGHIFVFWQFVVTSFFQLHPLFGYNLFFHCLGTTDKNPKNHPNNRWGLVWCSDNRPKGVCVFVFFAPKCPLFFDFVELQLRTLRTDMITARGLVRFPKTSQHGSGGSPRLILHHKSLPVSYIPEPVL